MPYSSSARIRTWPRCGKTGRETLNAVRTILSSLSVVWIARGGSGFKQLRSHLAGGTIRGAMSLTSCGIVVWAAMRAPIGWVAALRESSVLFALLLSVGLLHERPPPGRIATALLVVAGMMLMDVRS